jgi:hypothetical protein
MAETKTIGEIHIAGSQFKDEYGRTLMLRGVNLGGSSKIPSSLTLTTASDFYNHSQVSFVNRPFSLAEADEHFTRLRHWGLTFLRLVVTWEAIEHLGPGQYDEAYLDYLSQLVYRAAEHGFHLFIDPHQDAWSRFSGGSGAPGWTLEAIGLDIRRLHASGAAVIHSFAEKPLRLQWITNYTRLATATMFTLFFGGNDFAPKTKIAGEPVQSFLQQHYMNAFRQVALKLNGLPNVIGFGTMNEPSHGFIGASNLTINEVVHYLALGPSPTPFQAMLLGAGYPQEVDIWKMSLLGYRPSGKTWLNLGGIRAWQESRECIWREHGVWDIDAAGQPRLLRPDYFATAKRNGQPRRVDFGGDYLKPFINQFAKTIRSVSPRAFIFVETTPAAEMPRWGLEDAPNVVNATHWYDVFTLFTALFVPLLSVDIYTRRPVLGFKQVQDMFTAQLGAIKQASLERMEGVPTLLGEFGISYNMPFKLNLRFNWFGMQEWAWDATFRALETHLLSGTLWNYTPDNTNRLGDYWNAEDLSIFSRDQRRNLADIHSGGRALRAVVRPYPRCVAGELLSLTFDYRKRHFSFKFRHDPTISMPTEIFVPNLHYPSGYLVQVSDGRYESDPTNHLLSYWSGAEHNIHTIEIRAR